MYKRIVLKTADGLKYCYCYPMLFSLTKLSVLVLFFLLVFITVLNNTKAILSHKK